MHADIYGICDTAASRVKCGLVWRLVQVEFVIAERVWLGERLVLNLEATADAKYNSNHDAVG